MPSGLPLPKPARSQAPDCSRFRRQERNMSGSACRTISRNTGAATKCTLM
ncbi:hypothetical protein [Azospirillum palustre]